MIEFKRTPYRVILVNTKGDADELIDALVQALADGENAMRELSAGPAGEAIAAINQRAIQRSHLHNLLTMLQHHYTEEKRV